MRLTLIQSERDSESLSGSVDDEVIRIIPESGRDSTDEEQFSDTEIMGMFTGAGRRAARSSSRFQDFYLYWLLGYWSWMEKSTFQFVQLNVHT